MSILTFLTFQAFPPILSLTLSFKSDRSCGLENIWNLVSVCLSWHSQHSWYSRHSKHSWRPPHSRHSQSTTLQKLQVSIKSQIRSILWFGKHMTLGVCMSLLIFSTFPTFQKLFNHVGFKSAAKCRLVDVANVSELHTKLELYRQSYIFGLQPLKNLVETTGTF